MSKNMILVCAWCDVYDRVECRAVNDEEKIDTAWTKCRLCGRAELKKKEEEEEAA